MSKNPNGKRANKSNTDAGTATKQPEQKNVKQKSKVLANGDKVTLVSLGNDIWVVKRLVKSHNMMQQIGIGFYEDMLTIYEREVSNG